MDGAMGTLLLAHGISIHSCIPEVNLTRPTLVTEIHKSYVTAGAEAILTNTFGANRPRLKTFKKEQRLQSINRSAVRIAKKAAGSLPVFASIGPLGPNSKKMTFTQMVQNFREQASVIEKEKPSGYLIESIPSLAEAKAATLAVREASDRTCITLLSFPAGSKIPSFSEISKTLRAAGADLIGFNCGKGPQEIYELLKALAQVDKGPFCVRPAGGLPGKIIRPEEFASWGPKFQKLGCTWIGGCCGTTPSHIQALKTALT